MFDVVEGQEFSLIVSGINWLSLGIDKNQLLNHQIMIYPSPNEGGMLYVKLRNNNAIIQGIQVLDIVGKQQIAMQSDDVGRKGLNVSNLKHGMYILKIITDSGIVNKKVVIK